MQFVIQKEGGKNKYKEYVFFISFNMGKKKTCEDKNFQSAERLLLGLIK